MSFVKSMPDTDSKTAPQHSTALLSIDGVRCSRGDRVLINGLSFDAQQKHCVHVIGPNGSGKTTLLRAICGLNRPDAGMIKWRGVDSLLSDVFTKESAYLGHKDGLKNELTALENIRFEQQLNGDADESLLEDCLLKLKILECADLPAQALSFGQRRRLAFAKLLLTQKPLWVLDEPFTGIDATGRELMENLCVAHLNSGGIIVMTHHRSLSDTALSSFRQEVFIEPSSKPTQ